MTKMPWFLMIERYYQKRINMINGFIDCLVCLILLLKVMITAKIDTNDISLGLLAESFVDYRAVANVSSEFDLD